MEFENLLLDLNIEKSVVSEIEDLLALKKSGMEMGFQPKRKNINIFIEKEINHFESKIKHYDPKNKPDSRLLDECFIKILNYGDKE